MSSPQPPHVISATSMSFTQMTGPVLTTGHVDREPGARALVDNPIARLVGELDLCQVSRSHRGQPLGGRQLDDQE